MFKNFINYTFIGLINTILGYSIILYLTYINITPEFANLVGYLTGFVISYILNKKYTFKSKEKHKKEFPKFIIIMSITYAINLLTLIVCFRIFDLNVFLSQILAGIVYIIMGYFLSKLYVFNYSKSKLIN